VVIMKFGGTSVAGPAQLQAVATLVRAAPRPAVVVVSAMGGVTDALLALGQQAEAGDLDGALRGADALEARHLAAAPGREAAASLAPMLHELRQLLHGVALLGEQTPRSRALLGSLGERLCAPLAAAWLRWAGQSAEAVDARELMVTDDHFEAAAVQMEASRERSRARLLPLCAGGVVPVVTGFIGATPERVTTLLGRGGSDWSGALFGAFLDADVIEIWTDVDGILSADPRVVRDARALPAVSYREAAEMSWFGAKVVHPKTMLPARERGIPVVIRNTFKPEHPGTRISAETSPAPMGVKTVTAVRRAALITVEGPGLAGTPGVARRIFAASEAAMVNVMMISQASSEQTVSLVVAAGDAPRLVASIEREFVLELAAGLLAPVRSDPGAAVVSIVGEGMAGQPGVSARLFQALARIGVNVLAIAQGGSELSVSAAIPDADAERAVRAVHAAFGLRRTLDVVLLGAGKVGVALLAMIDASRAELARARNVELRLLGLSTSRSALVDPHGVAPADALRRLGEEGQPMTAEALIAAADAARSGEVCLVDLTAADTADVHLSALDAGLHVVTANKKPIAGSLSAWRSLVDAERRTGAIFGYETTFGAGLPVLHTLKELVQTGDEVEEVSGCFSGTLGFLCSRLQDGCGLVEAVAEAQALGYTEPDPRDDLSGADVARKALIVARAMGLPLEPDDVELAPFVPGMEAGLEDALAAYADPMAVAVAAAAARGGVLRYVATIRADGVRVGLQEVSADSAIGSLRGPDNLLQFRTRRYRDYPLVIRGPGAGAEVTAAGVLGDLIRVATGS
jgi:aspartokinase/homoserine dehydrogenase 1